VFKPTDDALPPLPHDETAHIKRPHTTATKNETSTLLLFLLAINIIID
jgi:hypothetical protein